MSVYESEAHQPTSTAEVARRLRRQLKHQSLTQSELARRLAGPNADARAVSNRRRQLLKWIGGEHAPTPESAELLSSALDMPRDYFLVIRHDENERAAEAFDAIEFARAAARLGRKVQPKRFTLPLSRKAIAELVPSFNAEQILLDEVKHLVPGEEAEALAHFYPDTAGIVYWWAGTGIVPGILQVEAISELAALTLLTLPGNERRNALHAGIDKTRFRQPLLVGTDLALTCRVRQMHGAVANVEGRGYVDGKLTVQTELIIVVD